MTETASRPARSGFRPAALARAPFLASTLVAVPLLIVPLAGARAEPARYEIDPDHTTIAFLVSHIGYQKVLGQFLEFEGGFTFDEQARTLEDLKVTIDVDSVETHHDDRDDHLESDDFLAEDEHPEITFVMTGAEATGERTGKVAGDLTIRGVTKPVTLDVTWNKSGPYPFGDNYVTGISARTDLKRSDFGMDYGVADGLVGDEVEVIIELEAIRQ